MGYRSQNTILCTAPLSMDLFVPDMLLSEDEGGKKEIAFLTPHAHTRTRAYPCGADSLSWDKLNHRAFRWADRQNVKQFPGPGKTDAMRDATCQPVRKCTGPASPLWVLGHKSQTNNSSHTLSAGDSEPQLNTSQQSQKACTCIMVSFM